MGELRNLGRLTVAALLAALLCAPALHARPIVFARSTTVMAEYRDGAMSEAQLFYAPKRNLSLGVGYLELDGEGMDVRHSVTYGRINFLAKRWNRESAQANIFLWGGAGSAFIGDRVIRPVQDGVPPPPSDHDHGEPAPPPAAVPIRVPALQDFAFKKLTVDLSREGDTTVALTYLSGFGRHGDDPQGINLTLDLHADDDFVDIASRLVSKSEVTKAAKDALEAFFKDPPTPPTTPTPGADPDQEKPR